MISINRCRATFFILLSLASYTVDAAATSKKPAHHKHGYKGIISENENSWFVGLGVGRSWTNLSNTSTTVSNGSGAAPPSDQDSYSINTPAPQTQVQASIGYRWHQEREFIPYYSAYFQYRHYMTTYIKGYVTQYSLPDFLNYNYQMHYSADLFTVNGKFNLVDYYHVLPYVSGGIGIIYNHLNNYNEVALPNVTARTNPAYAGNTNHNLAGTLGAGLDVKFTKNIWATLGYEYLFQGSIKTGNGDGSWSGTKLTFGKKAKMQTVFLSISANIPDGIRS